MRQLYELDPEEVSLVPRGANKKKFLITKSSKGNRMPAEKKIENAVREAVAGVDAATMKKVETVVKAMTMTKAAPPSDGTAAPSSDAGQPLSDHAQAALKAMGRIGAPFKDEINQSHIAQVMNEVGVGAGQEQPGDNPTKEGKVEMSMEAPEGVSSEDHTQGMDEAHKAYMGHMEKLGYQKYPSPQPTTKAKASDEEEEDEGEEDDVSKTAVTKGDSGLDLSAFPKEQRPQLEAIFKSFGEKNKELVEKNANLEKELRTERDERVSKEFKEKATAFKHLGTNTDDLAKVMKSMSEKDPESFKVLEKTLKAADEQIAKGDLFKELGSKGGTSVGDAEAKLDALVDSVVQKSGGEKTRDQIYSEVLKTAEGKRLYKEYKSSRPGGV